ncbi:MAG: sortase [Chloroflexota bacterium]
MRRALALLLAVLLLGLAAAPASADTVRRTWRASIGTSGANGAATLWAYLDGDARMLLNLRGLQPTAAYAVEIRGGSCASLGSVLTRTEAATTDAIGAFYGYRHLTQGQMNDVWTVARRGSIVIRLVSGTSVRCASLAFYRATRVRIPAYSIDLPVIPGPGGYPPCNVAMYVRELSQPREPGVTMIYAHARRGMFLPLLRASKTNNGAAMIGKLVYVYTSDSKAVVYRITQVRRHVTSIQNAFGITSERLWLYTSEGPSFSYPKLVVVASRVKVVSATYSASHPRAKPVKC